MKPTLWIFEDQLAPDLPTLAEAPAGARVFMVESDRAWRMVPFHKRRLAFLAAAMRHFAQELRESGRTVDYYPLRAKGYLDSISALRQQIKQTGSKEFWIVEPSEHHTRVWLDTLPDRLSITIRYFPNTLFLTDREEFARWARPLKSPVMESFYRKMRQRHQVLMDGDEPTGGAWNLDKDNRKPAPRGLLVPPLPSFKPDAITREVMAEIDRRFANHPGSLQGFDLPVARTDAVSFFKQFIRSRLAQFGDYEDAMVTGQPVLFHSMISPLINAGLLRPTDCIRAAEQAYRSGQAPLNSAEGFIRQILGWREYVYGIYHAFMPEYRLRNARKSSRALPQLYWDGRTEMNCLKQCVGGVLENGYTHHIQRLMVLCNFATLIGVNPQQVNDWFYAMYIDSHDWVVTPNVIGMGMNADGGTMASKPYISSAAYINRMSDYCAGCRFNAKTRTEDDSCPFNYLFWTFLHNQRSVLKRNPRMTMMLKNADRLSPDELSRMTALGKKFVSEL